MSDRYETPRWDDEPEELVVGGELAGDAPDDGDEAVAEVDLEASSENVLDGWPAGDPTALEAAEEGQEETGGELVTGAEIDSEPMTSLPAADDPSVELADHVSASMEHAPGDLTVPPGYAVLEGDVRGENRRVGIVVARFNGDVTTALLESALDELEARGVTRDSVTVMPVPGAFELPLAAMALAKTRRFSCVVALGCVIRGDTPHFDYVSSEAASGLQLAAIETGVPVAFGVLTLDRADQAESRYAKGAEAVRTGLEMADLFANLRAAAAR